MRYFIWMEHSEGGRSTVIKWVSDCCEEHGSLVAMEDNAAEAMSNEILRIESADRSNVVTPVENAEEVAMLYDAAVKAAAEEPDSPAQLSILREQNHLCPYCIVESTCTVGIATKSADAMLTTVNACLGFQPKETNDG